MNGAAMNCRQDPDLRAQHQDSRNLHNSGYHHQIHHQQNLHQENSKILNYPSISSNYQVPVDGFYDKLHQSENIVTSRHSMTGVQDPRFQKSKTIRCRNEPIDLPVPQFEIDEHSVSGLCSKGLDLDTRIGLLIKSKALVGMHPIFSDLINSEESESDIDDPFLLRPSPNSQKGRKLAHSIAKNIEIPLCESFDDPEKPLSRPPSPFLSRATYLFWFNKAIEIKQQARAQEKALLEQAAKKLAQETSQSVRLDEPSKKDPCPKNLLDEVSKELKEFIKQELIREMIDETALKIWEESIKEESGLARNGLGSEPLEFQESITPKAFNSREMDVKPEKFQKDENVERSCEKIFKKHSAVNHKESFVNVQLAPCDMVTVSSSSIKLEGKKPMLKESINKDMKKKNGLNYQEDHNVEEGENRKRDSCDYEVYKENVNCVRSERRASEVAVEKEGVRQFITTQENNSEDVLKLDEKYVIVKDILDFIFNNVNKIVLENIDAKHSFKEGSNKLDNQLSN